MDSHPIDQVSAVSRSQGVPPSRPRFPFVILFLVLLLVVVTCTLVTFTLPEWYSSTARIKVERDRSDIAGLGEREVTGYDPYFIQTEFEVIQSEVILAKVIEDLALNEEWGKKYNDGKHLRTSETIGLLKQRIDLRPVRNTSLIEIRVASEKPDDAARIANAVAEIYKNYRMEERVRRIEGSIAALEMAYLENNREERSIRAEMAELSRAQGSQDSNRLAEASGRLDALQRSSRRLPPKRRI
jgi:capsular polysaccharide biosynthesis protein